MTLFSYILKDFLKYVLGTIVLCLFMFILFDFIHKTTKYFAQHQPSTEQIIMFYAYQIPTQLVQALPIASLLGSVIAMVLLSRTNEITAMRAAGMGPLQIGAPIAIGGLTLSLIAFSVGEFVAPASSKKMRYVENVLIEKQDASAVNEGTQWLRSENNLYHFEDYNPITRVMQRVRIIETGLNFRPKQTIEAQQAVYQPQNGDWLLQNVRILYFNPNGTLAYSERRESQIALFPIEPEKMEKEHRKPEEMGLLELQDIVARGEQAGIDISTYKVDMHAKFAFYFASFVVCLIGLKFGYRSERTVESVKGIIFAGTVALGYWFILSAGKAASKQGELPPVIGAWMANFIIFGVGCWGIWSTRKGAS